MFRSVAFLTVLIFLLGTRLFANITSPSHDNSPDTLEKAIVKVSTKSQEICPPASSKEMILKPCTDLLGEDEAKIVDLVVEYYFAKNATFLFESDKPKDLNKIFPIPPKFAQRLGQSLMRFANVFSELDITPGWLGPSFGLAEKAINQFLIMPKEEQKIEKLEESAHQGVEIQETETMTPFLEEEIDKRNRAKAALIKKMNEVSDMMSELQYKKMFGNMKGATDILAIGIDRFPDMLTWAKPWSKYFISPLQYRQLYTKVMLSCSPVVSSIKKKLRTESDLKELNGLEHILLESILKNSPDLSDDLQRCGLILLKTGCSVYNTVTTVPFIASYIIKRVLLLAAMEAANSGLATYFEYSNLKSIEEDELPILLRALGDTYSYEEGSMATERLQKYLDKIPSAPLTHEMMVGKVQFHLAKNLIAKEPELLSYIILNKLIEEERLDSNRTRMFLIKYFSVSPEEIQSWIDIAKYFGPNYSLVKQFVLYALRLD